jgi:hypothetical protein
MAENPPGSTESESVLDSAEGESALGSTEGRSALGSTEGRSALGSTEGRSALGSTMGESALGSTVGRGNWRFRPVGPLGFIGGLVPRAALRLPWAIELCPFRAEGGGEGTLGRKYAAKGRSGGRAAAKELLGGRTRRRGAWVEGRGEGALGWKDAAKGRLGGRARRRGAWAEGRGNAESHGRPAKPVGDGQKAAKPLSFVGVYSQEGKRLRVGEAALS